MPVADCVGDRRGSESQFAGCQKAGSVGRCAITRLFRDETCAFCLMRADDASKD
jgi:hypothetical protein